MMRNLCLWVKVLAYTVLLAAAYAQSDFVPDTCVDSAGFNKCWSAATSKGNDCYARFCGGANGRCTDVNNCFTNSNACMCCGESEVVST